MNVSVDRQKIDRPWSEKCVAIGEIVFAARAIPSNNSVPAGMMMMMMMNMKDELTLAWR